MVRASRGRVERPVSFREVGGGPEGSAAVREGSVGEAGLGADGGGRVCAVAGGGDAMVNKARAWAI